MAKDTEIVYRISYGNKSSRVGTTPLPPEAAIAYVASLIVDGKLNPGWTIEIEAKEERL
jgi:hypothetical protein